VNKDQLRELERQCHDAGFSLGRAYSASLWAIVYCGTESEAECREKSNNKTAEMLGDVRALHQALGEWLEEFSVSKE
jgi:hypothetical protein